MEQYWRLWLLFQGQQVLRPLKSDQSTQGFFLLAYCRSTNSQTPFWLLSREPRALAAISVVLIPGALNGAAQNNKTFFVFKNVPERAFDVLQHFENITKAGCFRVENRYVECVAVHAACYDPILTVFNDKTKQKKGKDYWSMYGNRSFYSHFCLP